MIKAIQKAVKSAGPKEIKKMSAEIDTVKSIALIRKIVF
jgi:hypothetical protein